MTEAEVQAHIDHINGLLLNDSNQSYSISPSDGGTSRTVSRYNRKELLNELAMWKTTLRRLKGKCGIAICQAGFSK